MTTAAMKASCPVYKCGSIITGPHCHHPGCPWRTCHNGHIYDARPDGTGNYFDRSQTR